MDKCSRKIHIATLTCARALSYFAVTHASSGLKQACEKDLVKLTIVDATNEFQLGAVSE